MRLITRFELLARNTNELYGLHRKVFNKFVKSNLQPLAKIKNQYL